MTKTIALLLACVSAATPCLWDSDTLDTELRGLPDAFDMVTGRWHRHGDAYYRQRVERLAAKRELTLAEHDDLAVAYEHLGDREHAIAVMHRKAKALAVTPDADHEYRRLANLGTFYAHQGYYDAALVELKQAVALNPKAHFGRERFQIELIEYVAAAQREPARWSEQTFLMHAGYHDWYQFRSWLVDSDEEGQPVFARAHGERDLDEAAAYEAIGGMLRWGGREGPELYRTLGELFLMRGDLNLAWWALHRAIDRGHPAAARLRVCMSYIEEHWRGARRADHDTGVRAPTPAEYAAIRANADRWLATFQDLEAQAIERGEVVGSDAVLAALLAEADRRVPRPSLPRDWTTTELGLAAVALLLVLGALQRWRHGRSGRGAAA